MVRLVTYTCPVTLREPMGRPETYLGGQMHSRVLKVWRVFGTLGSLNFRHSLTGTNSEGVTKNQLVAFGNLQVVRDVYGAVRLPHDRNVSRWFVPTLYTESATNQ